MHEAISTNVFEIKKGVVFSLAYPQGRSAADYLSTGHIMVMPNGQQVLQSDAVFYVSYGDENITVSCGLVPVSAGGVVTLFCPLTNEHGTVVLTQGQYDAIATPDEGTLYLVPDEA